MAAATGIMRGGGERGDRGEERGERRGEGGWGWRR